ncbi:metallophosphoesterase [Desulfitobacterium sp.]|uniref:metallophosphoesterase n=1 Tax=Desulfitobacterium sp. TaxID=49981 RepID=UPI002BE9E32C|nr:metallophosphoesterase [Desulfitobacterium sp.]HVJ49771.1 metallophosphoesterase [Desulfitobacterium sp.]
MEKSLKTLTRRGFLRGVGGLLASHWALSSTAIGGAGILALAEHDTLTLEKEFWDLSYPALPAALEGKRIVQLSDLHLEQLRFSSSSLQSQVNAQKSDLLVLTGDLISDRTDLDKVVEYLQPLTARFGKYMVMGNNDYWHFSRSLFNRYMELLLGIGWIPLINDAERIKDLNLWIIGVDDPATAHDDVAKSYAKLSQTSSSELPFRLVLSHSTDSLDDIAKYGAELLLTGHTHGGQIRLPGMKPLITNTYLGDNGIYEGYHVIEGVPLYINRGIGESGIPLRLNVPPEIAIFTLHKGQAEPVHRTE